MGDEIIEVTIDPNGGVKIAGVGFKGAACEQATRALEQALGRTVTDERTSEFYEEEKAKVSQW